LRERRTRVTSPNCEKKPGAAQRVPRQRVRRRVNAHARVRSLARCRGCGSAASGGASARTAHLLLVEAVGYVAWRARGAA
jgi:hypothetical protein